MGDIMTKLSCLPLALVLVLFSGCAGITEYHREQAKEFSTAVQNEGAVAKEFIEKRWAGYSGALSVLIEHYPTEIPLIAVAAKKRLDELYNRDQKEWTDMELGEVWMYRYLLISEAFQAILRRLAPNLLSFVSGL